MHFRGEGGECVTVEMATRGQSRTRLRACEAILVQTATFDIASNAYDAESNGNFDQVILGAAEDEGGSYDFEYRDGDGSRLVPPSRMPKREAAREEAVRSAMSCSIVNPA